MTGGGGSARPQAAAAPDVPIRDAATVIILRRIAGRMHVLIGQRGAAAAFMPSKFVFPGGAVDPGDADLDLTASLRPACLARLRQQSDAHLAPLLLAAAIRETWEETGLRFAEPGAPQLPPAKSWAGFYRQGLRPSAAGFSFVFRAVTPPGRPRRFDARFFVALADHVHGDPDDFSEACDELSHLQWVPLDEVRSFDLPFITEVVLAEVAGLSEAGMLHTPSSVPFFNHTTTRSGFVRLR